MNPTRQQLLNSLGEFSEMFPSFRLGQMICNLMQRVKNPASQADAAGAIWDIEDEELLASINDWMAKRRNQLQQQSGPAA